MAAISSYDTIQKFGLTYYSMAQSSLKQRDKNEGNNDGKYDIGEFKSSFINLNNAIFSNNEIGKAQANNLVNSQNALFEKYAGSDSILDTAEYIELINSDEYNKFISKYNSMTDAEVNKTQGTVLDTNEKDDVKTASPLETLNSGDKTQELTAEMQALINLKPVTDKRFNQISRTGNEIIEIAGRIMGNVNADMSACLEKYLNKANSGTVSAEQKEEALEECEEQLEKIQQEALEKIRNLREPMRAVRAISDITTKIEPGQVDLNEPLEMILNAAKKIQTSSKSSAIGKVSTDALNSEKKSGVDFSEQQKKTEDKIKEQIKILNNEDSSESQKIKAQNNLQIWLAMKEMFETLTESSN